MDDQSSEDGGSLDARLARRRGIMSAYSRITPYLLVDDADGVIAFLQAGLGGKVHSRHDRPAGGVRHASVEVCGERVMVSDAQASFPALPAMLYVYVDDVDAAFARMLAAGGSEVMPPYDADYGDRNAGVRDPGGNIWWIASPRDDIGAAEYDKILAEADRTP